MTDTDRIEWLQHYYSRFRELLTAEEYELEIVGDRGESVTFTGGDLRECIDKAVSAGKLLREGATTTEKDNG